MTNVEYGDREVAISNEILRSVVGSGVHGIAIPGTDDHDEMGVYIEPPSVALGVEKHREDYIWRTQPEGVRSGHGDTTSWTEATWISRSSTASTRHRHSSSPAPNAT